MDKETRQLFEDVADCIREINEKINKLEDKVQRIKDAQDDMK